MAMYDPVHAAMHGDSALSAIDSEILHGSRLAGATLTNQLHQGSVKNLQHGYSYVIQTANSILSNLKIY